MIKEGIIFDNTKSFKYFKNLDLSLKLKHTQDLSNTVFRKIEIYKKDSKYHYVKEVFRYHTNNFLFRKQRLGFTYDPESKKINTWDNRNIGDILELHDLSDFGLNLKDIHLDVFPRVTKTVLIKIINNKIKSYKNFVIESAKVSHNVNLSYEQIKYFSGMYDYKSLNVISKFEDHQIGYKMLSNENIAFGNYYYYFKLISSIKTKIKKGAEQDILNKIFNNYSPDKCDKFNIRQYLISKMKVEEPFANKNLPF